MGYTGQRIEIFEKSGDDWLFSGTVISTAFNVEVNKGIGKIKNSFSFRVPVGKSFFDLSNNPFKEENLVKIWMWRDSSTYTDTDLQIQGVIRQVDQEISDKGDILSIKGDDFTEIFFENYVRLGLNQGKDKKFFEMIQYILEQLRQNNDKQIYWANESNGYSGTPNPTTKDDGSNFPQKTLIMNYTRASELLEKLTSDEFTEDGQYLYWIEEENDKFFLIVRFKGGTIAGNLIEGNNSFQTKISKRKEELKNFVIFFCGNDLYGKSVEDVYYDTISIGKFGFKTYYSTELTQDIFDNIWNSERHNLEKVSLFNPDSEGNPQDDFPTSYPPYIFAIDGFSASNDKTFNNHLIDLALSQGNKIAKAIVDQTAKPRYTLEHNSRFTNKFNRGEKWQCNFPSRNINRALRIEQIRQTITETSLDLKEDERDATIE